ncbi:hypothetical protein ABZ912_52455 [Nonomuraea angiospora]|uniref:hypothetical protein n=1 Tax=Nonomuraea angiospora TaxID=46172 RepID=UPI0033C3097E
MRAAVAIAAGVEVVAPIETRRRFIDDAVSPVVVPTLEQVRRLLWAVRELRGLQPTPRLGPHLFALFCLIFFSGIRPSEGLDLKVHQCRLPMGGGWGSITLEVASPDVGELWTDDGEQRDARGLKHRSTKAVRPRSHSPGTGGDPALSPADLPASPHWRLLYGGRDQGTVPGPVHQSVWRRARKAALSRAEHASAVARRTYDLRHANASMLIAAGMDPAWIRRRSRGG